MQISDDLITMTQSTMETIDREEREALAERRKAFVLPKGDFPATLTAWEKRAPEKVAGGLFDGQTVYTTAWEVNVNGTSRKLNFIDACPALVRYSDNRISLPTLLARALYRVAEASERDAFETVLTAAVGRPVMLTVARKADGTKNYITRVRVDF